MSFTDDLNNFRKLTMAKYEKVKRLSAFDLFSAIVLATPVDKGVLRNNWFAANGTPNTSTTDAGALPGSVISRIKVELNKVTLDKDIYFTNNLPYAIPIEFDGHSPQAPNGMVRINTGRWDTIVALNVKKVNRR